MANKTKKAKPGPKKLRPATQAWIKSIEELYRLDSHHLMILTLAANAWDRIYDARCEIRKSGLTFTDRYGSVKTQPAVKTEHDASVLFSRLIRELNLDIEEPGEIPRLPVMKR